MMATIANVPFNLSLVKEEFKSSLMLNCGLVAGLTPPFMCSQFIGLTDIFIINITDSNHDFDANNLVNAMTATCGGNWVGAKFKIVVHANVELASKSGEYQCMWFGGMMNECESIIIENHGYILGRGGDGGVGGDRYKPVGFPGSPGKVGIVVDDGVKLTIDNYGSIGGGGGGGGAWNSSPGGGGAPLGAGGAWMNGGSHLPAAASFFDSGIGDARAGNGGAWGERGANSPPMGNQAGGAAGSAIELRAGATVEFINRGEIYGEIKDV